jgi:hypothetical protein
MALGLPKFRWLIIGAVAAGVWVVREDFSGPRPPERVPSWIERIIAPKPQPSKPVAATAKADKPVAKPAAKVASERPVPPKPVTGKPSPQKAIAEKTPKATAEKTALLLPRSVDRPPSKPQKIVTGSITRPDKPTFVQTRSKVFMRAQAKPDAEIIATLGPRTVMRELARSGEWRLLMGDGRKGWVRSDYLAKPTFLPRRPKLPLTEVKQAKAKAE